MWNEFISCIAIAIGILIIIFSRFLYMACVQDKITEHGLTLKVLLFVVLCDVIGTATVILSILHCCSII